MPRDSGGSTRFLLIFCFIDGFVPILPSETLIVALGALSVTSGQPNMWWVMAAAALGAIAGDNMAYMLGRQIGVERFRWMRKPKVQPRPGLGAL